MVSYVFITFQLCSKNYFLKQSPNQQSAFHEESLQSKLEFISSNLLLNAWVQIRLLGPCQAKLWIFPAGEISLLLWATHFNGYFFARWSCFFLSPGQNFSWSSYSHCPFSYHHQPYKERTSTLSAPIFGHGKTVIKFPLSLLFLRLRKTVLSVLLQTSSSSPLLTSSWLYCSWLGCNLFTS